MDARLSRFSHLSSQSCEFVKRDKFICSDTNKKEPAADISHGWTGCFDTFRSWFNQDLRLDESPKIDEFSARETVSRPATKFPKARYFGSNRPTLSFLFVRKGLCDSQLGFCNWSRLHRSKSIQTLALTPTAQRITDGRMFSRRLFYSLAANEVYRVFTRLITREPRTVAVKKDKTILKDHGSCRVGRFITQSNYL